MKLLFSADWHIKLNTKNIPNEWAVNRYKQLFGKLHELEKSVDMHIIGGDIFDKLPSMQELELYFEFIADCRAKTIIIPGNHEATKKGQTFLTNLKKSTNLINSLVEVIDDYLSIENIDFIPYNKLKEYNQADINFHGDILVTHVRGEIPPHVKPEVNLELFDRWKVVLAGDLHSYGNSQRNILYPGSPITTSFHRNSVDTGVIIFDSDTLSHTFIPLNLPQLIRRTIKVGDEMVPTHPDHTIFEIEGDMSELGNVTDNALIDKKVVKRNIETALILSPEMSVEQEITEYLSYILELSEDTIEKALQVYNDNKHLL
jgi:DNA repair exonuclease SbcCD nuclease subunit